MVRRGGVWWSLRCGFLVAAGLVVCWLTACANPRVVSVERSEFFPVEVPTSLPFNAVAHSKEELGKLLKDYGIHREVADLESLDFTNHAVIFSVDASVAEVRRNPGVDIILLRPEPGRGLYVAVVRGDVKRLGKFTWK